MIRYKLRELMAEKEFQRQKRLTIEEVAAGSGVHRVTLSKMLNQFGYRVSLDVIERLCQYFAVGIGELLSVVPEPEKKKRATKKAKE